MGGLVKLHRQRVTAVHRARERNAREFSDVYDDILENVIGDCRLHERDRRAVGGREIGAVDKWVAVQVDIDRSDHITAVNRE